MKKTDNTPHVHKKSILKILKRENNPTLSSIPVLSFNDLEKNSKTHVVIGFSVKKHWLSRIYQWVKSRYIVQAWISFYDTFLDTRLVIYTQYNELVLCLWNRWKYLNTIITEYIPIRSDLMPAVLEVISESGLVSTATYSTFFRLKSWLNRRLKLNFRSKRSENTEFIVRVLKKNCLYFSCGGIDSEKIIRVKLLRIFDQHPAEYLKVF
jgi:hypothetical protein